MQDTVQYNDTRVLNGLSRGQGYVQFGGEEEEEEEGAVIDM